MSTITKNHLVNEVVRRTGSKRALAKEAVDRFFGALRESLMEGNRIEIRGFGVWTVRKTNPRPNVGIRGPGRGSLCLLGGRSASSRGEF